MFHRSTLSLPVVDSDGNRPLISRNFRVDVSSLKEDVSSIIVRLCQGGETPLDPRQEALLRSYIFIHYHPELATRSRIQIYHFVKKALEQGNLEQLRSIAGIRQRSAYINTLSNVGKRSSYFGGLIGITVAGYLFLPPLVKLGILPFLRRAIRNLKPKSNHIIPIDSSLKLSALVDGSPDQIYQGIRKAIGPGLRRAGKRVPAVIDTTPMDDLVGNLFFRALIDQSSFSEKVRRELRDRAQIAFLYDMARVSRQLEGLARDPALCWERVTYYTNFAMFLNSLDSPEVPIQAMLQNAVEIISRARIGSSRYENRFYAEFERGLRFLNYALQVTEPLDRFNLPDAFDDMESEQARIAFFDQNHRVMERLYMGHENELARVRPMFVDFCRLARDPTLQNIPSSSDRYRTFQKKIKQTISAYSGPFFALGKAELRSYDLELQRIAG